MSTLMRQLEMRLGERRKPAPYTGPDKSSKNGNKPLTFPTPYHGGKRRWADEILRAFGPEREAVYVEPFSGSAAVLLANERPYAREILCDTNPHIVNVFRALAWAPEVVAFWADWPTIHQDLTSRHTWLLHWAVENATEIETNPDFYDPKAAGWWLWGKSNWIGSEFGIVKGMSATKSDAEGVDAAEYDAPPDKRPHVKSKVFSGDGVQPQRDDAGLPAAPQLPPDKRPQVGRPQGGQSGQGVQANRVNVPFADKIPSVAPDKRPQVGRSAAGQGVSAQRAPDSIPSVGLGAGGSTGKGVSAQTSAPDFPHDKIPSVAPGGGRGISAQGAAPPESGVKRPHAMHSGRGVSAQRADGTLPAQPPDCRPAVTDGMRGSGVSTMRETPLPYAPQLPPHRDDIPYAPEHGGGRGVNAQRKQRYPDSGGRDAAQPEQLPQQRDKRPFISTGDGGNGVQTQRQPGDSDAPLPHYDGRAYRPANDKVPNLNASTGVQAGRHDDTLPQPPDKRPAIPGHGPVGIQSHSRELELEQRLPSLPAAPIPLTGDRLKPWFLAIAQRLYRVIILNRGWQSGLTPTVLQQTRTARKPPVRVLLDPPYKGVGKLYGMSEQEADALAIASWRWAAENGSRPTWRIAYACREGDFDDEALALGWTCSKMGIAANHRDSTQEVIWFSPYCER